MLPEGKHVLSVVAESQDSLLSLANPSGKKLIVDCSTIETKISIEVGKLVDASGHGTFADAPVSVSIVYTAWAFSN